MVIETRLECLLSIEKAIKFAKSIDGIFIPKQDEEMIFHCRKSFLFCDSQPWTKIGTENFDVPMGSYDRTEICELVGLYLLHKLTDGKGTCRSIYGWFLVGFRQFSDV